MECNCYNEGRFILQALCSNIQLEVQIQIQISNIISQLHLAYQNYPSKEKQVHAIVLELHYKKYTKGFLFTKDVADLIKLLFS